MVAPGGFGTILEFFYALQVIQVKQSCNVPIILFGRMWPPLIKWIEKYPLQDEYISRKDTNPIFLAKDVDDILKVIDKAYKSYCEDNDEFCSNYTKYRI